MHDYLGMVMTYDQEQGSVKINMEKYVEGIILSFTKEEPEEKLKEGTTPATNNLFKTRDENAKKLSKRKAGIFNAVVAKLLFVSKRARPDILVAVSFLTTRVKEPDEDDWNKLVRILSYLKCTPDCCLHLNCTDLTKLTWFVDGSFASHGDMRGQSGAILVTRDCAVIFKPNKQKVNTRSSTETELIAVDDLLATIQWAKSFMEEQGYNIDTEIKEENKSTLLLMRNGRLSSGKRTKHLDLEIKVLSNVLILHLSR